LTRSTDARWPRLRIGAIVFGFLADILGTLSSYLWIAAVVGIVSGARGTAMPDLAASSDSRYLAAQLCLGLFWSGLGAFIAAQMARENHLYHAAAVGILTLLFGTVMTLALQDSAAPLWYHVVGSVLILPVSLAGGWIAAQSN
jgi:hypothetical protein